MMVKLQQFLDGERDFNDAVQVEEFVVPVTCSPDGAITDESGQVFGPLFDRD